MLLRQISYKIALQFTGFVFLLFMVNGAIFLVADFENARRTVQGELERSFRLVVDEIQSWPDVRPERLPPRLRERIRIISLQGVALYEGSVFANIPFTADPEYGVLRLQNERFRVFTAPIVKSGVPLGFVQVAHPESLPLGDLPLRAAIYLLVSILVSCVTFLVGLFFARSSLKPAEETMQRLEQFTQDASHELKTPLAALRSSLELALKNGKHKEGLLSAREDVKEVTVLVEHLLELARLDKLALEQASLDLSHITGDVIERHRALAMEKSVTIGHSLEPDVFVKGDPGLFRQLLTNLIGNAVKFNKPGGTVTVTLTRKFLSVADTGIGIRKEEQEHIFDRFFQADTSRAKDGYGLGLALVKRIADLHGWALEVKSTPGQGTAFTVRFSANIKRP